MLGPWQGRGILALPDLPGLLCHIQCTNRGVLGGHLSFPFTPSLLVPVFFHALIPPSLTCLFLTPGLPAVLRLPSAPCRNWEAWVIVPFLF